MTAVTLRQIGKDCWVIYKCRQIAKHVVINQSQSALLSATQLFAVGNSTQLVVIWFYSRIKARCNEIATRQQLHHCLLEFLFQIYEVLAGFWMLMWISVYVDGTRFATDGNRLVIFSDLSQLIPALSQTDCSFNCHLDIIQSKTRITLTLSYCCFVAILMHQSKDGNWLGVMADMLLIFKAKNLKEMRSQGHCTVVHNVW